MEVKESIAFTTRIYNFLSGLGLPVSPVEFAQAVYSIEQAKPKNYDALKRIIVPIMARNKEQHLLLLQIIDFLLNTSEDWERVGNSMGIKHIDPLILRESAPTIAKLMDWVAHPELFYKRLQELYLELHDRYQDRMENSGYMLLAEALELDRPEKELVVLGKALELAGWCPEDVAGITAAIENMLVFIRRNISEFILHASKVAGATTLLHGNEPKSGEKELWNIPLSFLSKKILKRSIT